MAIQLLKLRGVPPDELEEVQVLLDEHEIDYYETSAGNWGISMPALWLRDEKQFQHARKLLDDYQQQRFQRVRAEYEQLKRSGQARTMMDMIRENPARYILYTIIVIVLVYFSIAPFLALTGK